MWWNLDIFGKFALEIRMDYWYLWKTHFLNFRDFQESPNPFKYRFPPLHPISAPDAQLLETLNSQEILVFVENPFFEL